MDAFEMRDDHDLKSALEAMLFVTSDPIDTEALSAFLEEDTDRITVALQELQETYQQQDRSIQLNERAGGACHASALPRIARAVRCFLG